MIEGNIYILSMYLNTHENELYSMKYFSPLQIPTSNIIIGTLTKRKNLAPSIINV